MYSLVNELYKICTNHPIQEKIIVVDSYSIGEQINEAFIIQGYQAINLKYKTIKDIAIESVELSSDSSINLIEPSLGAQFIYSILKELKQLDDLQYFTGMEISPSFSRSLLSTIQLIRLAGYTGESLDFENFLTKEKGRDLAKVLEKYEQLLKNHHFFDDAMLYEKAIELAGDYANSVFILQSNLPLSRLEEQFLGRVLSTSVYKLPIAPVYGITIPEKRGLRSIVWGQPTTLSYLYQLEQLDVKPNLSVYAAKTEEIEAKNVIRQIKDNNLKLDESVVFYTVNEPYITLFYHLSEKADIPLTFAEGLPVTFSKPGKLVSALIKWMKENYSVEGFVELLQEGILELGEGAPSKTRITKILRELQIGWSKDRYLTQLQHELYRLSEIVNEDEATDYQINRFNDLTWLYGWFSSFFKKLPQVEELINYKSILVAILYSLKNYVTPRSALDEIAKTTLQDEIEKILPFADELLPSYDAFEKVNDFLLTLRIYQSRPKPGHLHIASYRGGVYNNRSNIFIVGLDNTKFPGGSSEDPLLLDTERMKLGNGLPLLQEKGQESLYSLLQVLSQSTGRISVSFCNFDLQANRTISPAHVFLQCYRAVTGDKEAEFKQLKNLPSTIVSPDYFEEKDFWNKKLVAEKQFVLDHELLSHFGCMVSGLEAERNRAQNGLTPYDGQVHIEEVNDRMLSAGKLELLAKCPYAFFLQEILRVKPIEAVSFSPYKWLDPATRGSLLHSIFETFHKELKAEKVKPSFSLHEGKITGIALKLLQEQKEILPPPSERVYEREKRDIFDCCRVFLKEEENHCQHYEPLHFEYSFGIDGKEPAHVSLPSGATIKIAGIVDRVDQSKDGTYHIIDYKTGSTYGYENKSLFKGGRQLQHMVYALAVEQHLQLEQGAVAESAYYFPTVKGLAQRYVRKQNSTLRTNGLDILEKLIEMIRQGHFTMTDDENDCKFCEYKLACRRSFYDGMTLEVKQMDSKLKGVRIYE